MAKYTKPITIEADSPEMATKVQDAVKNMLSLFTANEIIKMSESVKNPTTRTMLRNYL
jgi:hypothetical protein